MRPRNIFKLCALIAIIVVAACFGLITVISFSEMPEAVEELPVAIVNEDKGAIVDGERVCYGQQVLDKAKESKSVKWEEKSSTALEKGIEETDYYIAFIIPENFSKNIVSGKTDSPATANIEFLSNMRKNFLISQITKNIKVQFEDIVSQSITLEYTEGTMNALDGLGKGLATASQAGNKLTQGSQELASSVNAVTIDEVKLSQGQKDSIYSQAASSPEITNAAGALSGGITSAMKSSLSAINSTQTKGAATAAILQDSQIQAALSGLDETTKQAVVFAIVSASLDGAAANISYDDMQSSINSSLIPVLQKASGTAAVLGSEKTVVAVNEKMKGLDTSLSQLKSSVNMLASGVGTLTSGIETMSVNVNYMDYSGDKAQFISDPVDTQDTVYGKIARYSEGFLPLFLSIGLWVGAVMPLFVINAHDRRKEGLSSMGYAFSTYGRLALIGVIEAVAIVTGALIIGIQPVNIPALYMFAIFISLAFAAIMECFGLLFGLGGNVLSILLTIIQIPACGGTFPVELMPEFFGGINKFLPMTYSIDGTREILSGGQWGNLWADGLVLLLCLMTFLLISVIFGRSSRGRVDKMNLALNK